MEKETKILWPILKNVLSIFAVCIAIASFVFAKTAEYRPIVITSVTRALNTAYQPSTSRNTGVSVSVSISSTLTLTAGQSGTIALQTSPDNVTYTTIESCSNNTTGALIVGINTVNLQATNLVATVPAGYYYKLTTSGTSTFSILTGQETQW